jgi:hypothetical protein
MTAFWLFKTAFALQLLALVLFMGYAVRPQRNFSVAASAALGLAALFQMLFSLLLALRSSGRA